MILSVGEILFDHFPDYSRPGGAPFNFAVHMKNLGHEVRFISRVGDDRYGIAILDKVARAGLDADDIQVDAQLETGYVKVKVDKHGDPGFDIKMNVAYDNITYKDIAEKVDLDKVELIYTGTLIQRTVKGFLNIQELIKSKKHSTIVFYDVNLRPSCFSLKVIEETLVNSDALKLNLDELDKIREMLNINGQHYSAVEAISEKYDIPIIAVTNGNGEAALFNNGQVFRNTPHGILKFKDTVGAGDAFSAVIASGLMREIQSDWILEGAMALASYICTVEGAIPDDKTIYDKITRILSGGI